MDARAPPPHDTLEDVPPAEYARMGEQGAVFRGLPRLGWRDAYHRLLVMPTSRFVAIMALAFLGLNVVFGGLYALDPRGVAGAHAGRFTDFFFFSVQTMASVGYGAMYPADDFANAVMTVEAFVSLANLGAATGLLFARFSRPTARVVFSRQAVVSPFEGTPTLMFRAANKRRNMILEAQVSLTLAQDMTTKEGGRMRRFHEMKVLRSRSPMFFLTWQVMHPIDADSPLFGETHESLLAKRSELLVAIQGLDETFVSTIHARHSYLPHEIAWGRRLVDLIGFDGAGRRVIDFRRFHDLA